MEKGGKSSLVQILTDLESLQTWSWRQRKASGTILVRKEVKESTVELQELGDRGECESFLKGAPPVFDDIEGGRGG